MSATSPGFSSSLSPKLLPAYLVPNPGRPAALPKWEPPCLGCLLLSPSPVLPWPARPPAPVPGPPTGARHGRPAGAGWAAAATAAWRARTEREAGGAGREWRELPRAAGRGAGRRGPGKGPRAHASAHPTRVLALAPARAPRAGSHACTLTRELGVHLRERRPVFPSSSRETQAPAPPRSPGASRCPASRLLRLPGLQGPTTRPSCHSDAGSHAHPPNPQSTQGGRKEGSCPTPRCPWAWLRDPQ